MEVGEHAALTEVMIGAGGGGGAVMVTVVVPDFVVSSVEVAVIATKPDAGMVAGAVNAPVLEMLPPDAVHVTAGL